MFTRTTGATFEMGNVGKRPFDVSETLKMENGFLLERGSFFLNIC